MRSSKGKYSRAKDVRRSAFGAFVHERRKYFGISLRLLAEELGVDASYWSRVERGVVPPSLKPAALKRCAGRLGLEPESEEWARFLDLAAVAAGRLPPDLLQLGLDETLVAVFSAVRVAASKSRPKNILLRIANELRRT